MKKNLPSNQFQLVSQFSLRGDQNQAVEKLTSAIQNNQIHNVLLGATGTGKTFTVANVIEKTQKSTLVISHNKTLALQLYGEFKAFFPHNRVEYFISPFDFYRPEAYLPNSDLYIDKSVKWNTDIKTMRISTQNALVTHSHVIVVASVAAIYGVLDPEKYKLFVYHLQINQAFNHRDFIDYLITAGYENVKNDLAAGKFIVRGPLITLGLHDDTIYLRIKIVDNKIVKLSKIAAITFNLIEELTSFTLFPAKEYLISSPLLNTACEKIRLELQNQLKFLRDNNEQLKAHRLETRTNQDLENLREFGYCKGIENYSYHLENRLPNSLPFTLLDYFPKDFLIVLDESHITLPQLKAMFLADRKRKQVLVDYGFRLPSALENRPLRLKEFFRKASQIIYTSATPSDFELEKTNNQPVEQLIRPTGLLDPIIEIVPPKNQIKRLIIEIQAAIKENTRVFVLTLTIKMAEDLSEYLQTQNFKVAYIHSKLKTFERTKILINFRKGVFDVVVGINLLREGLDIPEVARICILDADQEGFLRDRKSLIQMIGRAARNVNGKVILFANKISEAMRLAIFETKRRRRLQQAYNQKHNIIPKTIEKPIQDIFLDQNLNEFYTKIQARKYSKLTRVQTKQMIVILQKKLQLAVKGQDFELAAKIRDMIFELMYKNSF